MPLKNGKIDWADWRPLGPETEPQIHARILIAHTMVGNLQGTDSMFKQNGYTGTESTFGLGGPWEGAAWDGRLYQWQYTGYQADAQYAGNAYADSVETADGGNPNHPWSSKQLDSLIRLFADWCKGTNNPCVLVKTENDHGIGYHSQFHDWNTDGHTCPGQVRIGQLLTIVIPKARAVLNDQMPPHVVVSTGVTSPTGPHLGVDGIWGHDTIAATQRVIGATADGIWGPDTRRRFQSHVGVAPDGIVGPVTVRAWKTFLNKRGFFPWDTHSGNWGHPLTQQHQKCLNANKF